MASKGVGGLFFSLSASAARFKSDMDKARAAAQRSGSGIKKSFSSAQKSSMAFSKALVAVKIQLLAIVGPAVLGAFIKKSLEAADSIAKTADAVDISTDTLQEYQHAARLSGVSTEALNSAFKAFSKRVGEARAGTGTLVTLLGKMDQGLLETVQSAKNTDEAFNAIVTAGANMSNQLDRAALFAAAFGRTAGVEMTNLVRDGVSSLAEMRKEAHDLGIVMDEELLRNAERVNDEWTRLSSAIGTRFKSAAITAADSVLDFIDAVDELLGRRGFLEEAFDKNQEKFAEQETAIERTRRKLRMYQAAYSEAIANQDTEAMEQLASLMVKTEEFLDRLTESTVAYQSGLVKLAPAVDGVTAAERTRIATYDQIIARQKMLNEQAQFAPEPQLQTAGLQGDDPELTLIEQRWQAEQDALDKRLQNYQQFSDSVGDIIGGIEQLESARIQNQLSQDLSAADQWYQARKSAITRNVRDEERRAEKLGELEQQYQARVANAREKAQRKEEQAARRFRLIKIAQAISNTALAITKFLSLGQYGQAFAAGALGGLQVAAIRAQPYAKGGVVDSPVMFPDRGGVGIAGEAGPEAILPLKRTPTGDLGVQATDGGGGLTLQLYFEGNVMTQDFVRNDVAPILEKAAMKGWTKLQVKK